jgi:hypothetical protein
MDKAAVREFRLRWERVGDLERAQPPTTPATRLRQLGAMLEIARQAQWPVDKSGAEVEELRRRWRTLRAKLSGRSVR